jgi:hypothetical protein
MVIARRVQRLNADSPDGEREMHRSISFSMWCDKISCRRVCRAMPALIFAITPIGALYSMSAAGIRWCNSYTFRRSARLASAEDSNVARRRFLDW